MNDVLIFAGIVDGVGDAREAEVEGGAGAEGFVEEFGDSRIRLRRAIIIYASLLCEKGIVWMDHQWPPAPANARRVESIGRLRLEIDANMLNASQPSHIKRRRYVGVFVIAAMAAELGFVGCSVVSSPLFPRGIDWGSIAMLLGLILVVIPAAYFGSLWIARRMLHTGRFRFERESRLLRLEGGRSYAVPETAAFEVKPARYGVRRIFVLWLTIHKEDKQGVRRIGLASFKTLEIAEQARREIESFVGAF